MYWIISHGHKHFGKCFFEDIKKTIKEEFLKSAIKLEKSFTKSSHIKTISSNILITVKDILARIDNKP